MMVGANQNICLGASITINPTLSSHNSCMNSSKVANNSKQDIRFHKPVDSTLITTRVRKLVKRELL